MVKSFLLISFFLAAGLASAQGRYELFKSIEAKADLISGDQLGNVYLAVNNTIYKYDRNGKAVNQFSNNRYGKIKSIDATDPYKIVVFYEDFRIILLLDNQLSENASPLDLQFADFDQPILACRAYNTGIWLFDLLLNNVYRLTLNLRVIQSSGNLSQILEYDIEPNFMIEYNNQLYVNNPETGILVFDQFGTYVKNIHIKNLKSFQVTEKAIYYIQDGKIFKYHLRDLRSESLDLPEQDIIGCFVDKNRLFIATEEALKIYDYME